MTVQTEQVATTDSVQLRREMQPARSRWGEFPPPPPVRPAPRPGQTRMRYGILGRIAAAILIVLLVPILLCIALAVKLDCPGAPVIYRQVRVGIDRRRRNPEGSAGSPAGIERRTDRGFGRPFKIWKFRTMIPDAEAATGPVWAQDQDPRVTRLGRLLRHLRLDELPQLVNVIRGEMSLIGPRPERPHFVERLSLDMPAYGRRLLVTPGITGLAQVEREYDTDINDVRTKLKYDLFYVEHRSTLMDLKILMKTVDVMLRGRGSR